jgi:hypothetical protein
MAIFNNGSKTYFFLSFKSSVSMNEMRSFMMLKFKYYVYKTFKTVAIVKYCLCASIRYFFIISVEL